MTLEDGRCELGQSTLTKVRSAESSEAVEREEGAGAFTPGTTLRRLQ